MTPKQKDLARHALGLDQPGKTRSYRNRYLCSTGTATHSEWMAMVEAGDAVIVQDWTGSRSALFALTPAGAQSALGGGESLDAEDFPPSPADVAAILRRRPGGTFKPIQASTKARGKNLWRSISAAQAKVRDEAIYLIKRHGGYFRPGAHGYTDRLAEAGLYLGKEARRYLDVDGLSLIPIEAVIQTMVAEREEAQRAIKSLDETIGYFFRSAQKQPR